jgi:hypothetical protein
MIKHIAPLIAVVVTCSGSAMAEVASADVNMLYVKAEMTMGDQFVCTAVKQSKRRCVAGYLRSSSFCHCR